MRRSNFLLVAAMFAALPSCSSGEPTAAPPPPPPAAPSARFNPEQLLGFQCDGSSISYPICTSPQVVHLANTGTVALEPEFLFTAEGTFFSESDDCPGSLAPGAWCTVKVSFHAPLPTAYSFAVYPGRLSATGAQPLVLSGTAYAPRSTNHHYHIGPCIVTLGGC